MAVGGGRVPRRWPAVRRRGSNTPPALPSESLSSPNKIKRRSFASRAKPGYGAAYGRRRDQDERFNRARAQEQEARGTGRNRAFGGMPSRRWTF
jgi:hypothetical protein